MIRSALQLKATGSKALTTFYIVQTVCCFACCLLFSSSIKFESKSIPTMPNSSKKNQSSESDLSLSLDLLQKFQRGIEEFNAQQFYACHDTLEAVWMAVDHAEKPFYQGILQIAVAFYHLNNLNWRGGAILLGEGINRLGRFEPSYQGIDVEGLVDQSVEWLESVQTSGEDGLSELMAEGVRSRPKISYSHQ